MRKPITMTKVRLTESPGLIKMFDQASKGEDHGLNKFEYCYTRYFGCGNHLYILFNECDEDKVTSIGCQHSVHPREIAKQLSTFMQDFKVVCVDVEIGGMGVYSYKEN